MAITSYPFDNQDTTESQYSKLFRELQDSGVVDGFTGTAFQPFGDSTGMNVKLRAGMAIVRGHVINSDAVFTVTLPAADSAARVDRIVLRLDPTANSITPTYIKGVAGQGAPAMTQTDTDVYDLPIATVNVAGSAPNIGPTDVTDVRPFVRHRVGVWKTVNRPAAPRAYQPGINPDLGGRMEMWDPTKSAWVSPGTLYLGSGTAFPTVGIQAGDTFRRTDFGATFTYSGTAWEQTTVPTVATNAARDGVYTTALKASLPDSFRIWHSGLHVEQRFDATNKLWRFTLSGWAGGVTAFANLGVFPHGAGQAPTSMSLTVADSGDTINGIAKPVSVGGDATNIQLRLLRTDNGSYLNGNPVNINWIATF